LLIHSNRTVSSDSGISVSAELSHLRGRLLSARPSEDELQDSISVADRCDAAVGSTSQVGYTCC